MPKSFSLSSFLNMRDDINRLEAPGNCTCEFQASTPVKTDNCIEFAQLVLDLAYRRAAGVHRY